MEACAEALGLVAVLLGGKPKSPGPSAAGAAERKLPLGLQPAPAPHLARLSGVVEAVAIHSERASRYHEGAGLRVDAALYELEQLRLELQSVVDPALLARTASLPQRSAPKAVVRATAIEAEPEDVKAAPARATRPAA